MYKCYYYIFVLLTVFICIRSEEDAVEKEEKTGRAIQDDFGSDQWKAVQNPPLEPNTWIGTDDQPNPETSSEMQPPKRRRLRKRKRRPQIIVDEDGEIQVRPRRRRPIRLDENRDNWHEMEAESPKRPYNRRRTSPIYQPEEQIGTLSATINFGNYDQENQEDEKNRKRRIRTTTLPPTTVQDIKALLKQSGGLSISEILQQRNLSLSDLLKGKQQAISALTEIPDKGSATEKNKEGFEYLDEQRKKYSGLYRNKENKIYTDVTKYDVVTEATTEKRIFVPSHPKYYTSLDYRPEIVIEEETSQTGTKITTEEPTTIQTTKFIKSVKENFISTKASLPITSAKLLETIKKQRVPENENYSKIPANAFKINIKDLFGFTEIKNETKENEDQGPLKMSFDLEGLLKPNAYVSTPGSTTIKRTTSTTTSTTTTTTTTSTTTTTTPKPKPLQDKVKTISAKEEIMEILKDEGSKDNLSKILESRNMTVDQLVEQRERGSSQRHLADIFHNKTKEPEPTIHHVIEQKIETTPERKPKSQINYIREIDINTLPDVSLSSEEIITSERLPGTSFPTYKIESNKRSKESTYNIPIWKTVYPSVYTESKELGKGMQNIEIIENSIAQAVNEGDDYNKNNNYDYDDYIQLPIGVKSAIFASLAIIGISLILFLTILMIFRWSQRHKRRLCYGSSFSCSKIKSPILEAGPPKRSIRTFVSETLGRKKSVYVSHMQSMSDTWDNDKPYQ